jgi:hypothetical protein
MARDVDSVSLSLCSKRGRKRYSIRCADRPGKREHSRVSVGSFNARSLKGDKWKLACHEFVNRNLFICGVSEHWLSGSDTLSDDETGVRFVYVGHAEKDNSKSGKHGVGFMMSWKAYSLWQHQGSRVNRVSPRVVSVEISLTDRRGAEVPFFFLQGYAVQQNCPDAERDAFWMDMQAAHDRSPMGSTKVVTMDINASIGTRQPHEDFSVCGVYGLQRVNPAGEMMKD